MHRSLVFVAYCSLCMACAPPQSQSVPEASPPGFRTTATIEDIMRSMIDPAADEIWDAVVTEATAEGVATTVPETNEDWLELRRHAITLIESTNLLLMEGRQVAAAGSQSEMPGVDLEPGEIAALLSEDFATWRTLVEDLHDSGVDVLRAVESLDVDALLVAGDRLDLACESCHARYWYPGFASRPDAEAEP